MVDCLSWHSFYGSLRSSKSYVKDHSKSRISIDQSNLGSANYNAQLEKKQCNSNNNNNNGIVQLADDGNLFLEFYIFNISRERSIHLCKNPNDKRLLIFYNVSNGLYKIGVRNGDVLIFLNDTNIIKPPVALSIDRVKSEFTALRRQNKPIQIGICRCADRSVFNNATVQHLGSLTLPEFENLSRREESNDTQTSITIVHSESKKLLSLFSNKKKSFSIKKRKSIAKKTNETDQNKTLTVKNNEDRPLVKQSPADHVGIQSKKESLNKLAQKLDPVHQNPSTQILTDACFIYRRQIVKQPDTNAMILRGREIAYEAANSPVLPLSMPSYSHDQIRELYGEIDRKTRRLQENQYIFHTPMIDAWNETPPWSLSSTSSLNQNQCPLPKFRLDKNDQTLFMTTFLSTGLSNRPTPSSSNEKDAIRGSFRTSVGERTSVSPSPLLLNVHFDYNKVNSTGMTSKDETSFFNDIQQKISMEKANDIISTFDLDFLKQNASKQSIKPTNDIDSLPPKLEPLAIKSDDDAIDIDSLIDVDEQTALAYHMNKESSIDAELHSLFSVPNTTTTTTCIHPETVDSHEIVKQDDRMKTIASPDDSCYHDALTSSIQSSIFSDNFFEQIETLNHINKMQQLEPLDVGELKTSCEINQNPACLYHLVFSYDEQLIEEQDDGATNAESVSNLTQDKAVVKIESPTNAENNYRQITSDVDDDFEELYQRYLTNLSQYHQILEQIEEVEQKQKQLSPIDENPNVKELNSHHFELSVQRQSNHIGHYGFEIAQTDDGKITISSIIDSTYCPGLNVDDEIIGIDNIFALASLEQCHLLLNSLWHDQCEYLDLIVKKPSNIPTGAVYQPVSSHSNILSWPIPKAETDHFLDTSTTSNKMQDFDNDFTKSSSSSYSSYKSQIGPRTTNVQRRAGGPPGIMTRMYQSYSTSGGSGGFSAGSIGGGISNLASIAGLGNFAGIPLRPNRGTSALVAVNETREKEKRELCQLNDKFAQYVEKVRFLEAQNRKLQLELEALQNKAGQGSSKIKEMYEVEMSEAKKLIDDTTRDRAAAEVKARDAEKEAGRYRKRYEEILNSRETDRSAIDRLQQQIAENEAQINLFRRRLADLEDEARRYKAETQRLASEIARLQNEIQNETFVKSSLDTEKMALEDELAMLKQMHEADLNELRSKTVVDVNLDPSHFFRNELAQAIRDIRNEFEALNDQQRADLHNRYMMSYNELILRHQKPDLDPIQSEQQRIQEEKLRTTLLTTRNEVAHMKARNEELNNRIRELQLHIDQERDDGSRLIQKRASEIDELRRKLEQLKKEYEEVTNMKTSLEKEINTYRELLEGTNNRDGLKQIVDHVVEEARRMEAERATGGGVAGSIAYSGGGRHTTISRTFIASSGTSATNQGIGSIVGSPGRSGASYSGGQGNVSGSYSHTSSRREFSSELK